MTEQIATLLSNDTNDAVKHNLDATDSYNFAYLDEQTKRMIRRALLLSYKYIKRSDIIECLL